MPDTTFTDVLLNTISAAGAGMLGSSNLDEMADHSRRLEKDIAQLYELVNRIAQQGDVAGKLHEEVKTLRAQVDELRDYAFGHRREIPAPGPHSAEETVEVPRHEHDCTRCTFLGRFDTRGESYDLYHCPQFNNMPTVIARWSSEGPDYTSGIDFGRRALMEGRTDWPLAEAYRRAKDRGLDVRTLDEWAKDREATAEHAPDSEVEVPLPRCTVCKVTECVVECAVCGRNVCTGCAHYKLGYYYHPKCDAGWQR